MSIAYASVRLLFGGIASASLLSGHESVQMPLPLASYLQNESSAAVDFDAVVSLEELRGRIAAATGRYSDAAEQDQGGPQVLERVCRVTAYHDRGITAAGVPSGVGQCAAPADIPFGTRVYIPELDRWFVVTDRTHKRFRHNTVDLFISSRQECLQFGRKYLECRFELPPEKVRYGQLRLSTIRKMIAQSWAGTAASQL